MSKPRTYNSKQVRIPNNLLPLLEKVVRHISTTEPLAKANQATALRFALTAAEEKISRIVGK